MKSETANRNGLTESLQQVHENYAHGNPRPLGGYLVTLGAYGVYAGSLAIAMSRNRHRIPRRPAAADLALTGIATHKLSRMLAKDPITSPLRAPFTRFEESAGDSEVHESVRGHGVAHAAGELVSCPFCMASWVATTLTAGIVLLPRTTRTVCAILTTTATSDTLQLVYSRLKSSAG